MIGEQRLAFVFVETSQDSADISQRHIHRPQQGNDPGGTSLVGAVDPVARRRPPLGSQQPQPVVAPELRDAQADKFSELADLETISFIGHQHTMTA